MIYYVWDSLILLFVAVCGYVIRRQSQLSLGVSVCLLLMAGGIFMDVLPPNKADLALQVTIAAVIGVLLSEVLPQKKRRRF